MSQIIFIIFLSFFDFALKAAIVAAAAIATANAWHGLTLTGKVKRG